MVKRVVVWTKTAAKQRRKILEYWINRNKSTVFAKKFINLISKQTEIISKHPESFKETDYPNTRTSAIGHFSIYYKHSETEIIITAFWDNRQDPKKILKSIQKENRNSKNQ